MLSGLVERSDTAPIPLTPLTAEQLEPWLERAGPSVAGWLRAASFKAEPGSIALVPAAGTAGEAGEAEPGAAVARAVVGADRGIDPWPFGSLPYGLPELTWRLDSLDAALSERIALGWALGAYRFARYKEAERRPARLVWPETCDRAAVERAGEATYLVRDLVNTPANDMGPAELALAAEQLAAEHDARISIIVGEGLLTHNYPAVHAVGRASPRAPRLIDLVWGDASAPRVTLVGKGVCFDTGGLDLKPARSMLMMKKDMAGAAHALGLARMIMTARLPVRLRVLIPAVENVVGGDAFKPMDVLATRKGLSVEVGDTDAEGRLILADALAEASDQEPALLIDFSTLTGAARAALGPDLPALFGRDERLVAAALTAGSGAADPLWQLPLWRPYARSLRSSVADTSSTGDMGFGGAIIAALFLDRFVAPRTPWLHLDLYGWNGSDRPGRPKGGEAMGMRAMYALIEERFGS